MTKKRKAMHQANSSNRNSTEDPTSSKWVFKSFNTWLKTNVHSLFFFLPDHRECKDLSVKVIPLDKLDPSVSEFERHYKKVSETKNVCFMYEPFVVPIRIVQEVNCSLTLDPQHKSSYVWVDRLLLLLTSYHRALFYSLPSSVSSYLLPFLYLFLPLSFDYWLTHSLALNICTHFSLTRFMLFETNRQVKGIQLTLFFRPTILFFCTFSFFTNFCFWLSRIDVCTHFLIPI